MPAEWAGVAVAMIAVFASMAVATWNWGASRAAKERDDNSLGLDAVRNQLAARDAELGSLQVMLSLIHISEPTRPY